MNQLPCCLQTQRASHHICLFYPAPLLSPDSKGFPSYLFILPSSPAFLRLLRGAHQIWPLIGTKLSVVHCIMYCSVHVFYPAPLLSSDSKGSPSERNRALLQQVEGRGTTAVALFVNALRQSGQLHLASSLDTEQRIRPSTSGGYFGKGRHKGWFSPYWFFDLEI